MGVWSTICLLYTSFGLTQEMIEDLPMHVLDDIYNGRHSPVLPVRVTDEHGETVESRTPVSYTHLLESTFFHYHAGFDVSVIMSTPDPFHIKFDEATLQQTLYLSLIHI